MTHYASLVKFFVIRFVLQFQEYVTPFLMGLVITWLQKQEEEPLEDTMYMVAVALCCPLVNIINHVVWEYFCFQMIEVGHLAHTAMKTMLFRKNFKMTGATNKDYTSGEINGIIMGESNRIWTFIWEGPAYIETPVHLLVSSYLVFTYIGWSGLVVVAGLGLHWFIGYIRAKTEKEIHEKQREYSTERYKYINESFYNIKSVKLFGWEQKFLNKIEEAYENEKKLENQCMLRNKFYDFLNSSIHHLMPLAAFWLYTVQGNSLTLAQWSLMTVMLHRVKGRLDHCFHLYRNFFHTRHSMERLWGFYCAPESQTGLIDRSGAADSENAVVVKGDFSWGVTPKLDQADKDKIREKLRKKEYEADTKGMGKLRKGWYDLVHKKDVHELIHIPYKERTMNQIATLQDIDIEIKKGSFTVIIGEMGCGKTSLLNTMIGEMIHLTKEEMQRIGDYSRPIGDMEMRALEDVLLHTDLTGRSPITINGTSGFYEQQSWIQNGKLRDNVLFGSDFDKRKYVETILACQLQPDLEIMPAGDLTEIGEKGINLSGGQKARLSLARAVYKRPDILIMDDPISALDVQVRKNICKEVFQGIMKDKTRILATHAVECVAMADHVIIMKNGKVQAQGSYAELKDDPYLQEIQKIHEKNQVKSKAEEVDDNIDDLKGSTSEESSDKGAQRSDAEIDEKLASFAGVKGGLGDELQEKLGRLLVDEADEVVAPNRETVRKVFKSIGGARTVAIVAFITLLDKYFGWHRERTQNEFAATDPITQAERHSEYMWRIYLVSVAGILFDCAKDYYNERRNRTMGVDIHRSTLHKIFLAPVNLFFDVTPIGKVLKIFNEDMHVFQGRFVDTLRCVNDIGSHVVVVFSILTVLSTWDVLFGFLLVLYVMMKISRPYLSADNQLHKVGSTLWGPIHSYFYECMRGTSTIRAFGQEEGIMAKQHEMLDKTTLHFIGHHSVWCWFNLRMFGTSKLLTAICIFVIAKNRLTQDSLSLVMLFYWTIDMHWLMYFVTCINDCMRQMTQAQRVYNLQEIPQEKTVAELETPEGWGKKGEIEFKDIHLRYRPNTDQVLKGMSLKIEAGEKVGIVGRTGAGKSTIFMAFSRIVELEKGSIEVDGVDISKLSLQDVREQLTMIPQDPTLFTGTLRFNLDPFNEHSDERILELVSKAGLSYILKGTSKKEEQDKEEAEKKEKETKEKKAAMTHLLESDDEEDKKSTDTKDSESEPKEDTKKADKDEKKDESESKDKEDKEDKEDEDGKGLKFKVQEEGKNLSVGERQLVCIIRAILRHNKIVLLDEATANIDVVTEEAIQKLIKEEFAGATVMTIAHRLNTIIESDKVLFMDKGTVLEYDNPQTLMADPSSAFSKLIQEKKKRGSKKQQEAGAE